MDDKTKELIRQCRKIAGRHRVDDGKDFRLKDTDPGDTGHWSEGDKALGEEALAQGKIALATMQERLYAQDRWSVLLIFQAMDAAGKDGAIKHVMSGINPQGCQVTAFGVPSAREQDHTWLWRCMTELPERGRIGIFNRSYYEETLVARVHPKILAAQKLAPSLVTDEIWSERFDDIRGFEKHLARNGTLVLKFFLHISKGEQRRRFLSRLDEPEKNWKFRMGDVDEREHWKDYQEAYEKTIRNTATKDAPWFVIPADHKWYTRIVVAAAIVEALDSLDLHLPEVDDAQKAVLEEARKRLTKAKTES
ncbi:polyphosphate kinase 2 family protein [Luteolibacter sp. Populi]|uniref:polyphosphate kinase 2 family protein n=1 Tax=Luteolibacter sp. Populi TaxID=3230487 RepID=UPI003467CFB1